MMRYFKNVRAWQWALVLLLIGLSAGTWYFLYTENLTLVYNDAKSYMNIARAVVDNQQPGLAQIGSVWLPLVHILKLPLIWIEWTWHSGFAGSILSMLSYALTVVGMYFITLHLTKNRFASVIAGLVTALNVNLLYLQSTPLTEPLYLAFLVWSGFFLLRYVQTSEVKFLLPLAFTVALQIGIRYDGWFVAGVVAGLLLVHELWVRRLTLQKAIGHVLLFVVPIVFACLLWFGWNAIIFGDPLYFATGPYSARAQQDVIDSSTGLITKGDVLTAFKAYGYAAVHNIGWWMVAAAAIGWITYFATTKFRQWRIPLVVLGIFLAIFVFNVLALFLGFSIINVPELGFNPSSTVEPLFNVRYGILVLPIIALGAGLLVAKWRFAAIAVIGLVVLQGVLMLQPKPITLRDGLYGSSAFTQGALANEIKRRVGPDDQVLIAAGTFNPVIFESGIYLRQLVHEGVQDRWDEELSNPTIQWIIMGSGTDIVYSKLHDTPALNTNYKKVYQDSHGTIFERTAKPQ